MANGMVDQAGGMQGGTPQPTGMMTPEQAQPGAPQGMVNQATMAEEEEFGEQASPDEQKFYDAAMEMAGEFLYRNKASSDGIMENLKTQKDMPEQAIADTVSVMIQQIDDAMQGQLPETTIIPLTTEIVPMVAELAEETGLFTIDGEEQETRVMAATIQTLFEDFGVDPAQVEEMAAMLPEDQMSAMMGEMQGTLQNGGATAPEQTAPAEQPVAPEQAAMPGGM